MTFGTEAINSSFVAPTPIKWRQPAFFGTSVPAITPVKKEQPQAQQSLNPFAVRNYSLDYPKRDFDTIDLLG